MVIAFINQKGGVAKTTSTLHLGAFLARKGKKTLLLDLDPQCDLSKAIGIYQSDYTIVDFLNTDKEVPFNQIEKNLYIISGYNDLEEIKLSRNLLKNKLELIKEKFDFILIDCQPQKIVKSKLTINEVVLSAVDFLMIPLDANANTLTGTNDFITSIERIKFDYNTKLKVLGIFFTIVDSRERVFKDYYQYLKEQNSELLFKTFIRRDTKLKQAQAMGKTIYDFDNKTRASDDFTALGNEFLKRIKEI